MLLNPTPAPTPILYSLNWDVLRLVSTFLLNIQVVVWHQKHYLKVQCVVFIKHQYVIVQLMATPIYNCD